MALTTRETELACAWLEDLRCAAHPDGLPLDAEALASLDCGLADAREGCGKPPDQYELERGL